MADKLREPVTNLLALGGKEFARRVELDRDSYRISAHPLGNRTAHAHTSS
jgi:hypothetical protein